MANWMVFALGALVLLNVIASTRVARSAALTIEQRVGQIGLVWFLAVVGPALVMSFLAADRSPFSASSATLSDSYPGDETVLAPGPSQCGCSGGGGDGD